MSLCAMAKSSIHDYHDALGMSHYTVFPYSYDFKGAFERDTVLNGPTCEVTFHLHDSIGDGWLTDAISIVDSHGNAIQRLGLAEGSEATVKVEVPMGEELSLHWAYSIGGKDNECSFELYDWRGSLIYATEGKPKVGELCRFTSNCEEGIDEEEAPMVRLYPNPSHSQVTIEGTETIRVEVFNALGQSVYQGETNELNVSDWDNGVYFVRIVDGNGFVSTVKFVKQ